MQDRVQFPVRDRLGPGRGVELVAGFLAAWVVRKAGGWVGVWTRSSTRPRMWGWSVCSTRSLLADWVRIRHWQSWRRIPVVRVRSVTGLRDGVTDAVDEAAEGSVSR